jgi:transcriptional regulator with XRE-family HTH domain
MISIENKAPDTGKALRVALAAKHMTRKDLASKIGVSLNHMSRLAQGKITVQGETLNAIAAALDMRSSEFLALGED